MRLAKCMPQAVKEVAAERQALAEARAAVEESAQAASEALEIERAKKLLEENAARIAATATQQQRRRETREERLERLRLERELREKEQQQKRRQRQLETAAARLHISVEDLEADENLLKSIEEKGSHPAAAETPVVEPYPSSGDKKGNLVEDEDELVAKKPVVLFSRPVISNEGIAREMKALEKLQQENQEQPMHTHANDGIRLPEEKEEDDDDKPYAGKQAPRSKGARGLRHDDLEGEDEDASFGINGLMRRRPRRL
ncbi:unnamed protein product [Phytomonas sp. Hart1]|nr:unnamed protein product [Phytomonas sp. Hart1]|eukprot:CCW67794.1 unnamed protein product [Phytomonas sp. isolate Hart1]